MRRGAVPGGRAAYSWSWRRFALAVRSSSAAEDLAGASYAGLYESFLDVDRDQLAEAVRRCWESATSQRVTTYQQHHQQPQDRLAMASLPERSHRFEDRVDTGSCRHGSVTRRCDHGAVGDRVTERHADLQ